MPEFQYDPSTGSSHQVSRSGTQAGEQPNAPTIEEVEQRQLNTSVRNLSSRARNDNGAFPGETVNLQAEQQLLELQAELSRETNQIKIEQLLAQVESLAGQLVGEAPEPIQKENALHLKRLRTSGSRTIRIIILRLKMLSSMHLRLWVMI